MPNSRTRRLPHAAAIALDVIADVGSRQIRVHEFELRMHQRGCDSRAVSEALRAFERRGWKEISGGMIEFSEAAYQAAQNGGAEAPRRTHRLRRQRAIPNLF
ncbi:MAG: hypothetical protein KF889_16645 [Alphaproteobacteria bacterium]|nr:hypothetical protein [Alphaproteobacteria bacterium]MCW5740001.1 hypothetical protein [Alphaproteobacteria bacterium]